MPLLLPRGYSVILGLFTLFGMRQLLDTGTGLLLNQGSGAWRHRKGVIAEGGQAAAAFSGQGKPLKSWIAVG